MGLRSPHTVEIPFVFNHIDVSESMVGPVTPEMRKLETASAGGGRRWRGPEIRIIRGCRTGRITRRKSARPWSSIRRVAWRTIPWLMCGRLWRREHEIAGTVYSDTFTKAFWRD